MQLIVTYYSATSETYYAYGPFDNDIDAARFVIKVHQENPSATDFLTSVLYKPY